MKFEYKTVGYVTIMALLFALVFSFFFKKNPLSGYWVGLFIGFLGTISDGRVYSSFSNIMKYFFSFAILCVFGSILLVVIFL